MTCAFTVQYQGVISWTTKDYLPSTAIVKAALKQDGTVQTCQDVYIQQICFQRETKCHLNLDFC